MSHSRGEMSGSRVASACLPPGSFLGPPCGAEVGQKKKSYLSQPLSSASQSGQDFPVESCAGLQVYLGPKGHPLGEGPDLQAKWGAQAVG